ncbi:hypothetical protein [Edaphobacter aggregans]|uniref:hypothetical protein n=1 Tax=Edaphobacter aggregans TaxID=570835 RepID=UPI0007E8C8CB
MSRYTEEQIVGVLKESEAGWIRRKLCREVLYQSADVLSLEGEVRGPETSEAQRQLKEENRKLKQMVAEQALDITGFKAVLGKVVGPQAERECRESAVLVVK